MSSNYPKQILILGGGFAGVYTARHLEQLLCPEEASITLINRENYWVYQPMLPEVISGSMPSTSRMTRLVRRQSRRMGETTLVSRIPCAALENINTAAKPMKSATSLYQHRRRPTPSAPTG